MAYSGEIEKGGLQRQWEKRILPNVEVAPELRTQISKFVEPLRRANSLREESDQRKREEYDSLEAYFITYSSDHNKRASEIESPEYQQTVHLATSLFRNPVFGIDCMDGRNLSTVQHGFGAGIFGRFRTAGGSIAEVVRGANQGMKLIEGKFTQALSTTLDKYTHVIQRMDSHLGCAARSKEEIGRSGIQPRDSGLRADVLSKKRTARAIIEHVQDKYPDKKVSFIFESYDPHSGFAYYGLDTNEAMKEGEGGYAPEVLEKLVQAGKIISTHALSLDSSIGQVLQEYSFHIDLKTNYVKSLRKFWGNIASMEDKLSPKLQDMLLRIYPDIDEDVLHDASLLVLTNMYSGYLHNQGAIEGNHVEFEYSKHTEAGIDITEGAYGPYGSLSTFEVSSHEPNPGAQVDLAGSIVRGNRLSQDEKTRVRDMAGNIVEPEGFARAIVPATVTAIIRHDEASGYAAILNQIDWTQLPKNWDTMSREEFDGFLDRQSQAISGGIPYTLARVINDLRGRTAQLYHTIGKQIMDHDIVVMSVIQDRNRRVLGIPAFVKTGF